jgi:micrococcal nuclease
MGIFRSLMRLFFPRKAARREPYRPADHYTPQYQPKPYVANQTTAGPNKVVHGIVLVERLKGRCYVVDGDTITIGNKNIRLAGVDAPEMDQPFGKNAKWALLNLCDGQVITAEFEDHFSYERHVATCYLPDGRDLSAEMVSLGLALDWRKFSGGKYRHLEPEGVRRKLWRVEARHRGRMPPKTFNS